MKLRVIVFFFLSLCVFFLFFVFVCSCAVADVAAEYNYCAKCMWSANHISSIFTTDFFFYNLYWYTATYLNCEILCGFCLFTILIRLSFKKAQPPFQRLTSSIFHYETNKCPIAMRTDCNSGDKKTIETTSWKQTDAMCPKITRNSREKTFNFMCNAFATSVVSVTVVIAAAVYASVHQKSFNTSSRFMANKIANIT